MLTMKSIVWALTVLILTACEDFCQSEVIETTQLTNKTTQDLEIELCKIPYQQLTGKPDDKTATKSGNFVFSILKNQDGTMLLDSYPLSLKKDSQDKCPQELPPSYNSQVFLTSKSFFQVKLCRDTQDPVKVMVISLTSSCPAGTTAQAQVLANCNETSLIEN